MRKFVLFFTFFLLFPLSPQAQIKLAQHQQLRTALDRDDAQTAEGLLREMARMSPDAFAGNNYDYLLARLLMRRDANGEANQLLQSVIARNSVLAGYAL